MFVCCYHDFQLQMTFSCIALQAKTSNIDADQPKSKVCLWFFLCVSAFVYIDRSTLLLCSALLPRPNPSPRKLSARPFLSACRLSKPQRPPAWRSTAQRATQRALRLVRALAQRLPRRGCLSRPVARWGRSHTQTDCCGTAPAAGPSFTWRASGRSGPSCT